LRGRGIVGARVAAAGRRLVQRRCRVVVGVAKPDKAAQRLEKYQAQGVSIVSRAPSFPPSLPLPLCRSGWRSTRRRGCPL
jgi:hypothetical protein